MRLLVLDLAAMLGLALAYIAPWILLSWAFYLLFRDPFLE